MQQKIQNFKFLDFVMIAFVTVVLLSNLLSSAKIIDLGFSIGPIDFLFDAGTLVFPISYIFGDILTEVYGYKRARRTIWCGFFAMALFALFIALADGMPSEAGWETFSGASIYNFTESPELNYQDFVTENGLPMDAGSRAYKAILGGVSGLAIASLVAYLVGNFTNSYVLSRMKTWTQGQHLWMRTIGSTLAGQAVDTVLFIAIATWLGVFSADLFVSLVVTNYVFKVGIEVFFTPITLPVVAWIKKAEGTEIYDEQINFNPFRLEL